MDPQELEILIGKIAMNLEGLSHLSNFDYLDLHTVKLAEAIQEAGTSIGDAIQCGLEQIAAAIVQRDNENR